MSIQRTDQLLRLPSGLGRANSRCSLAWASRSWRFMYEYLHTFIPVGSQGLLIGSIRRSATGLHCPVLGTFTVVLCTLYGYSTSYKRTETVIHAFCNLLRIPAVFADYSIILCRTFRTLGKTGDAKETGIKGYRACLSKLWRTNKKKKKKRTPPREASPSLWRWTVSRSAPSVSTEPTRHVAPRLLRSIRL